MPPGFPTAPTGPHLGHHHCHPSCSVCFLWSLLCNNGINSTIFLSLLCLLLVMHAASSSQIHGKYPLLPTPRCVPQSLWDSPLSAASSNLLNTTCSWPLHFCVCCPLFLEGPFLPNLLRPLPTALRSGDIPWELCWRPLTLGSG